MIMSFNGKTPENNAAFVADSASVIGSVTLESGSSVWFGAVIGKNCLIGAGAVVTENKVFPDNSLIIGVPAKAVRQLTEAEIQGNIENAAHYCRLAKQYAGEK